MSIVSEDPGYASSASGFPAGVFAASTIVSTELSISPSIASNGSEPDAIAVDHDRIFDWIHDVRRVAVCAAAEDQHIIDLIYDDPRFRNVTIPVDVSNAEGGLGDSFDMFVQAPLDAPISHHDDVDGPWVEYFDEGERVWDDDVYRLELICSGYRSWWSYFDDEMSEER